MRRIDFNDVQSGVSRASQGVYNAGAHIYRKSENFDYWRIIKLITGLTLILFVFMFASKIYKSVRGFLGMDTDPEKNSMTNSVNQQAGGGFTSSTIGSAMSSASGNTTGFSGSTTTKEQAKKYPWRPVVDAIYDKLAGYNVFSYPEIVNKLAHMSKDHVKKASHYWHNTYKAGTGLTLAQFIGQEDESGGINDGAMFSSGFYKPALGALKKAGYPETKIK